jgi:RHS repeat-associated protein
MVDGVITHRWLYKDQLNPVAQLNGAGELEWQYVYASKPNVPDFAIDVAGGGTVYRVVSDQLGSVVLVVNVTNASDILFGAQYSAFGEQTVLPISTNLDWGPFGFAGGLYDSDTGLVRFGARDYDPETGRWTAKDPIRFDGGLNLYVYAGGDPVNYIDLDGRFVVHIGLAYLVYSHFNSVFHSSHIESAITFPHPDDQRPGGAGDAFRHCFAMCRLASVYGKSFPRTVGEIREADGLGKGHDPAFCYMDLQNNDEGLDEGANISAFDAFDDCRNECLKNVVGDELHTLYDGPEHIVW